MGVRLRVTRKCRTNVITTFQAENLKAEMHPLQVGNLDDTSKTNKHQEFCTGWKQARKQILVATFSFCLMYFMTVSSNSSSNLHPMQV